VVGVLVHASEAFRVDDDEVGVLFVWTGDGLLPEPETLCAGVDSRTDLEAAFLLVEQHTVHEETFACAVLADDGDNTQRSVFGQCEEELLGLSGKREANALLVGDEGDCEGGLGF
jgi:hypothetical protein